ncbi:MAG TPA: serine/threonine-protein kinase [Polyangia bacterium]|nr:serine/threonine-protein kinase [Polyangia bacterium]
MSDPVAEESHTLIEGTQGAALGGATLARGTVLASRYEIVRRLGQGGVAVVMQARDRALGVDVAIKVLRPDAAGEAKRLERLAKEVKLARQIRHPNVCRVFDFGEADGHAFLVMELARGSLREELARDTAPARPLAARLADARAVAEGLAAVHAAGIVHRDVTPQNVLRTSDGRLVVSDFGLATLADPTASSLHGGTIAYMAPEIARGDRASLASDVWALGVIIHEIVFGRRPSWRQGRFGSTMAPAPEADLGVRAQRIVDLCVRCTDERERRRPTAEIVSRLVARAAERADGPSWRRAGRVATCVAAVAIAGLTVFHFVKHPRVEAPTPATALAAPASPRAIPLAGEPADWTKSARVLATVDGRIEAVTVLPGGDRVRVAWGEPRHVEDVTLATGSRTPAPLPQLPARGGPPVPSPDGASIASEGYDDAGRPFVFLGAAQPGAHLAAVAAAADPSLASEPRWLADGRAFVYDADVRNAAVFSLDTNRATILPAFDAGPSFTTFKAVVHDRVLVARVAEDFTSQLAVFSWPDLALAARFDLAAFAVEWQSRDGRRLYGLANEPDHGPEVVAVDVDALGAGRATRLGHVPGETLRTLALAGDALVFSASRWGGDVQLETAGGPPIVTHGLVARDVARGGGRVLATLREDGHNRIFELDEQGHVRRRLTDGPTDESPSILPGGDAFTYVRRAGESGFYRCTFGDGRGAVACTRLLEAVMPYATVSPDGRLVAYIDPQPQGPRARLIALDTGEARDLGDAGSYCAPVWSSARTVWVSRRTQGVPTWVELDVDAGGARTAGRTQRGSRACPDGLPDPAAPVRDGAKVVVSWRAELRTIAAP